MAESPPSSSASSSACSSRRFFLLSLRSAFRAFRRFFLSLWDWERTDGEAGEEEEWEEWEEEAWLGGVEAQMRRRWGGRGGQCWRFSAYSSRAPCSRTTETTDTEHWDEGKEEGEEDEGRTRGQATLTHRRYSAAAAMHTTLCHTAPSTPHNRHGQGGMVRADGKTQA